MTILLGSRKHVLDLLDSGQFAGTMSNLLGPHGIHVSVNDVHMPLGHAEPEEWTLRRFCSEHCRGHFDFARFDVWWVPDRYRNPQWDLLCTCSLGSKPGLLLVEAKANDQEMDWKGKPLAHNASPQSRANHDIIGRCIDEANTALNQRLPGFAISRDTHYQLSNRMASAWMLAECGLPVALLYLGFLGDEGIRDAGEPIKDRDHWQRLMGAYLQGVIPNHFPGIHLHEASGASMRMLVEALPVLEFSSPKEPVAPRTLGGNP